MLRFQFHCSFTSSLWLFLKDWWAGENMHDIMPQPWILFAVLSVVICWGLWRARCNFLFDHQAFSVNAVVQIILPILSNTLTSAPSPIVRCHPRSVSWTFLPFHTVKINVDGSAKGPRGLPELESSCVMNGGSVFSIGSFIDQCSCRIGGFPYWPSACLKFGLPKTAN